MKNKMQNLVALEKHFATKKQNSDSENKIIFAFFSALFCLLSALILFTILL